MNKRIQESGAMTLDTQIGLRRGAEDATVNGSNEKCIRIFGRLNALRLNELGTGMSVAELVRLQRGLVYRVFTNLKKSLDNQEKCDPGDFVFLVKEWSAFYVDNHDIYTFAIEGFLAAKPYDVDELYEAKKAHSNLKPIFKQNPLEKRIWKKQLAVINSMIDEREDEIGSHRRGGY
jgi:hypothetical protein